MVERAGFARVILSKAARLLARSAVVALAVLLALLAAQAFRDRRLPALEAWQRAAPLGEFTARDADAAFGLDEYLALENKLFAQLDTWMVNPDPTLSVLLRYVRNGPNNPATFERNWNRTTELVPDQVSGGVLLVHGLTDSPYSMRSLAEAFESKGLYTLCLRLPGHGTVPAALRTVSWADWLAAVEIAARHVRERIGPGKPLYVCGYSCGGALATLYSLEAAERSDLPRPDRVFLFSPAIGITAFAMASNWHRLYSWIPAFEKSRWMSIEPEYDPYKYNSFAKNAGAQMWELTRQVQDELDRAAADGRLARLPPILTFQSAVDSTIVARDVVERLYDRLPDNGSELVAFDVNSFARLDGFYRRDPRPALRELMAGPPALYRLTIVQNEGAGTMAVTARSRPPSSAQVTQEPVDAAWPTQVYSLAHVAIPFPPDDPIYGDGEGDATGRQTRLGDLSLRGEKNVLVVSAADLMRLRYNPFHAWMLNRIFESIAPPQP